MKIREQAGKLRGVRVMKDPDGILMNSFMDGDGITRFGYFLVSHEGSPAVYDGLDWHPIFDGDESDLADIEIEQRQSVRIASEAGKEDYMKLMALMLGQSAAA